VVMWLLAPNPPCLWGWGWVLCHCCVVVVIMLSLLLSPLSPLYSPWCTHHPPNEQLLISVGVGALLNTVVIVVHSSPSPPPPLCPPSSVVHCPSPVVPPMTHPMGNGLLGAGAVVVVVVPPSFAIPPTCHLSPVIVHCLLLFIVCHCSLLSLFIVCCCLSSSLSLSAIVIMPICIFAPPQSTLQAVPRRAGGGCFVIGASIDMVGPTSLIHCLLSIHHPCHSTHKPPPQAVSHGPGGGWWVIWCRSAVLGVITI
jgi:hypothetical protein